LGRLEVSYMRFRVVLVLLSIVIVSGCSVRKFAINKIGDALASGGSTYESDDDLELVQGALPFGLKLIETMLAESPKHRGLLFAASQGFTSYAYLAVPQDMDRARGTDYELEDRLRARARRLYLRAHHYGLRGIEVAHPGFSERFPLKPREAVRVLNKKDLQLVYWTAASLGLAISCSRDDVDMVGRIPEVEALIDRGVELDETWNAGAFHEFAIVLASAKPGEIDYGRVARHYQRAVDLSKGASASVYVTYAETVDVQKQDREEFQQMLERALATMPGEDHKNLRLMNELAHRRASWLLARIDDLILAPVAEKEKP
jgi:predicted anti-sigma-YlaC factor YlaD